MDLWSLAGSNLYGSAGNTQAVNAYLNMTAANMINPYAYLNSGQSLLSGSGAFAQQLGSYGQFYGNNSLQSVVQVIEKNPELKEKVTDTLKDVYQAMAASGSQTVSKVNGGQAVSRGGGVQTASRVKSAQAADAYRQQMSLGKRTPTLHAPAKLSD